MCGLFGWLEKHSNSLSIAEKEKLNLTLAWKTETRGNDSFGFLVKDTDNEVTIIKGLGSFKTCRLTRRVRNILRHATMVMGHTRQATHGEVNIKNAHPFECEKLIMAHNGVITSIDQYQRDTLLMPKGETDSETLLTWVVSKNKGVKGFFDASLFYDSFTIYDKSVKKLYLVTKGRSLYYLQGDKCSLYGSEPEIIESTYKMIFNIDKTSEEITSDKLVCLSPTGVTVLKTSTNSYSGTTDYYNKKYPVTPPVTSMVDYNSQGHFEGLDDTKPKINDIIENNKQTESVENIDKIEEEEWADVDDRYAG